jgi:hypothetical protein
VDTDGDALEDVTLRVSFRPGEADGRQSLEVRRLDGRASRGRTTEGSILTQGHTGDTVVGEGDARVWAGIAGEPLYKDIAGLALVRAADESRAITGALMPADAGWTAVQPPTGCDWRSHGATTGKAWSIKRASMALKIQRSADGACVVFTF